MSSVTALLERIYNDADFASGIAPDMFPVSITKEQGIFLRNKVSFIRPHTLIEIGMRYGVSSLWIQSTSARPKTHIIIDPFHHFPHPPKSLVIDDLLKKQKGVTIVDTLSSQEYLASCLRAKMSADVVFVDASQWFDSVMTDMYFISRILRRNGRVMVRNIWSPSVRKALIFYIRNLPYRIVGCPRYFEWCIKHLPIVGEILLRLYVRPVDILVLRLSGTDRREWNHFIPFT